jgi:hypothetical protein
MSTSHEFVEGEIGTTMIPEERATHDANFCSPTAWVPSSE